jgi:hypothetical protein
MAATTVARDVQPTGAGTLSRILQEKRLISMPRAAEILERNSGRSCSVRHALHLVKEGHIPGGEQPGGPGTPWYVPEASVESFQRRPPGPVPDPNGYRALRRKRREAEANADQG